MKHILLITGLIAVMSLNTFAQKFPGGQVHGNFQTDVQYYQEDEEIGAEDVPEDLRMNAFANIIYTNNKFEAGFRYENYTSPLLGFDDRYKGAGFPYRYARYNGDDISFTVGSFYEQFGNGLVFRSYEERTLGYDNAMDGIRIKASPVKGINLKGIYGKQRFFFEKSDGIVRGADGEFYLNDLLSSMEESKTKIFLGGSVVSKYEKDENAELNLPENVAAFAGRANVIRGKVNFSGEYAYKVNDPSSFNNFIYKEGQGAFLSFGYAQRGLGANISGKWIDNMSFHSNRNETGNALDINFLPALTKQHKYTLLTMYPYATQPNGEFGLQAELIYKLKRKSALGGKYGATIEMNYSRITSIKKQPITDTVDQRYMLGYETDLFSMGDDLFFEDFNVMFKKKINKNLKTNFGYMYQVYNQDVIAGHPSEPNIEAHIGVADITYKFTYTKSLRLETQYMSTDQDKGDWALGLLEYTIAPKWFFTIMDQYNLGNEDKDQRHHYYNGSIAFAKGAHRLALSYGRQREGVICVGGVCRNVPASTGFMLTLTSSF